MSTDGHGIRLDAVVTECGDTLTGVVTPATATAGSTVVVARYAATTGDSGVVIDEVGAEHRLVGAAPDGARFALALPVRGPISHTGRTFTVTWRVELVVDGVVEAATPITVLPAGGLAVWAQHAAGPPDVGGPAPRSAVGS